MRAAGSCWNRGKLESVCILCEQLLFYPRLQSFCRNMDAVSPSFLTFPEKLGFCILMQNLPSFQWSPNCGPYSACLCVLCCAEGKHWKTSEAFPAWPLCVSPALPPVLRLMCPELQATSALVQLALSPVCPMFLPLYLCSSKPSLEGPGAWFPPVRDLTGFQQLMAGILSVIVSAAAWPRQACLR